jgi:hypothetical protein
LRGKAPALRAGKQTAPRKSHKKKNENHGGGARVKLLVDVAPLDAETREVLVQAWAEIFRAELAARRTDTSAAATNRNDAAPAPPSRESKEEVHGR